MTDSLKNNLAQIEIQVPRLQREVLIRRACSHYNQLKTDRTSSCRPWTVATPNCEPEFLERICVNYLRHQLSPYESHLEQLRDSNNFDAAYLEIFEKVCDAIAAAYPWLKDECEEQLTNKVLDKEGF